MDSTEATERLHALDGELELLAANYVTTEFRSWHLRTRSLLRRLLGADHHISAEFDELDWISIVGDESWDRRAFNNARAAAHGILHATGAELELMADDVPIADEAGVDPELWEYISSDLRGEAWDKVARSAVVFTEDRLRKWANRPPHEVGDRLAVAIFGDRGDYRLGIVDGEKTGWQLFAQGTAMALRNVDTHRIQERPDLKRYALGVVGACSLLLTQMRYLHGNRFYDTSPSTPDIEATEIRDV